MSLPLVFWFVALFLAGAAIGSFLNVCIHRMPLEKSPLWPLTSRCAHCYQPIRAVDNIPLVSYWLLRGRCRTCGERFSVRYFVVELLTALGFVGLFYLVVISNVHRFNGALLGRSLLDWALLVAFLHHAILFCFLVVATFSDFDHRTIPLSLTLTGTAVGLVIAVLFPWPWPYTPAQAVPPAQAVQIFGNPWIVPMFRFPPQGLFAWPVWGPLPPWLAPGGNWQTGLATGVAGVLAGTMLLRAIRFCFGFGMGPAYMEEPDLEAPPLGLIGRVWSWLNRVGGKTLGLGDADLMMMAGAFLGWQPTLAAFFIAAVGPGIIFGLVQFFYRGENALPFGPSLAAGAMIAALSWQAVGPQFQVFFFNGPFLLGIVLVVGVLMVVAGYVLRLYKLIRGSGKDDKDEKSDAKTDDKPTTAKAS